MKTLLTIEEKDRTIEFAKALTLKDIEIIKEKDKEIEELKAKERRLKRALYKACANWAICEIDYWRKCLEHVDDYFYVLTGQDLDVKRCEKMIRNWINSKIKCLKKAEKYK